MKQYPSGSAVADFSLRSTLKNRLAKIEDRLCAACRRVGRERTEITLVAVTKSTSAQIAGILPELGVFDLGESRPQQLWDRAAALPKEIRWHLVGHLQRNKIDQTLPLTHLIHSVDSIRLLKALDEAAAKRQQSTNVLLEVNASRELNKHGFVPEELPSLVPELASLQYVQINGLMTMAALEDDPQRCRPTFTVLRDLRDRLRGELGPPHRLEHLSMGMSNDFEVAVEEGATLVRIGGAFFEGISES